MLGNRYQIILENICLNASLGDINDLDKFDKGGDAEKLVVLAGESACGGCGAALTIIFLRFTIDGAWRITNET
jgi:hypothetical protein